MRSLIRLIPLSLSSIGEIIQLGKPRTLLLSFLRLSSLCVRLGKVEVGLRTRGSEPAGDLELVNGA
jgi:hypothetical protein